MVGKKSSPPSSGVEKSPKTGRTRPLPAGIVSGFRRLASFQKAALVSTLAPLLDPGEAAPAPRDDDLPEPGAPTARPFTTNVPHFDARAAEALRRFDEIARALPIDRRRLLYAPAFDFAPVRFMCALDVGDPVGRWRAVVSRAFARADAVAWCLAEGIEDDAALVDWAERTEKALDGIEPSWRDWQDHREAWLRGPVKESFDRAWRRRYFASPGDHDEMFDDLSAALETLAARAAAARGCAAETTEGGRTPVTYRNHFVLTLATVYALVMGEAPVFDGGDPGDKIKVGTERKRAPSPWHPLIRAALDLTGLRGGETDKTLDAALRSARLTPGAIQATAATSGALSHYPSFTFSGFEIDVGLRLEMPTTRADAYAHPATLYVGRSRRG